MKAMLVGRVGVAMMHLVGGPMDGERTMAVVGAPVVMTILPPLKMEDPRPSIWAGMSFYASTPTEGDEWKTEREREESRKPKPVRHALYLPEIKDGKATGVLMFGGEFLFTDAAPQG